MFAGAQWEIPCTCIVFTDKDLHEMQSKAKSNLLFSDISKEGDTHTRTGGLYLK